MSRPSRRGALFCAIGFALSACTSGTAPGTAPDISLPANTVSMLQSLAAPLTSPVLTSFGALVPYFSAAGAAAPGVAAAPLPIFARQHAFGSSLAMAPAIRARFTHLATAAAIFPDSVLGKTFVWDTSGSRYVVSTDAGAPPNGVRFELYALALECTGSTCQSDLLPHRPLTLIGHADVTDQSTAGAIVLGVAVRTVGASPVTLASYALHPTSQGTAWVLSGFVADATTRLDVTSTVTSTSAGTGEPTISEQTTADVAAQDIHASESESFSLSSGGALAVTTDFSLTSGGATVRTSGTTTFDSSSAQGNLQVTVNGQAFATIGFASGGPSYTAAKGVKLTPADEQALLLLWATSDELFFSVSLLTGPAVAFKV